MNEKSINEKLMNEKFMNKTPANETSQSVNVPIQNEFVICAKDHLDNSAEQLPSHIVSKLRQARYQALEQGKPITWLPRTWFPKTWLPRTWLKLPTLTQHPWIASCASLLAVVLILGYTQLKPTTDEKLMAMDEESEILFADDNIELYEDLEFYRWLANTGY
jgi:hypothetical protein